MSDMETQRIEIKTVPVELHDWYRKLKRSMLKRGEVITLEKLYLIALEYYKNKETTPSQSCKECNVDHLIHAAINTLKGNLRGFGDND